MKVIKKIFIIFQIDVLLITILTCSICTQIKAETINKVDEQKPVKVAVLFYDYGDVFISLLRNEFEEIQKENSGKVEFTYYDGKNNQAIQDYTLHTVLEEHNADLILLNIVNPQVTKSVINKIKEYNIPVVLFNREPISMNDIKSYDKAYYVGTDEKQSSSIEGNIIVDLWKNNKKEIDKNKDNKLQYVMLMGELYNQGAIIRTKYSVLTINDAGIKTDEVALLVCNWRRNIAKTNLTPVLLGNINRIEAIIANNDEMAIGAVQALQQFGYNKGGNSKTIYVVGIDATPDARELVKKGEMAGTVIYPIPGVTKASYIIGLNLVNKRDPLYGTQYKFDESGVAVRLPYEKFTY